LSDRKRRPEEALSGDTRRIRQAKETAETDAEVATIIAERLKRMHEWMADGLRGAPGESDRTSGLGGSVVWCFTHEREAERCHAAELDCAGLVVVAASDPTGEASLTQD